MVIEVGVIMLGVIHVSWGDVGEGGEQGLSLTILPPSADCLLRALPPSFFGGGAMADAECERPEATTGVLPGPVERRLLRSLRPSGQVTYVRALVNFREEMSDTGHEWKTWTEADRDYFLAEYLVEKIENGELTISNGSLLLAVLSKVNPREKYKTAWKVLDGFRAEAPVKQAPARPAELAFALAVSAVLCGLHEVIRPVPLPKG